ncbi:uncharacterized protein LOC135339526 isoform X2 [Halichondria panicea]|uniref:uncharacterized protein LOC135339526 isoform X2 n=1 Tax=Halichondria panicea TaxID=6063 RepID=UPI00312BB65D
MMWCFPLCKAVMNGITADHKKKVLAAFLEKCPEQYTISPPVDQQNSASDDKTDHPAVGTNRVIKMKPGSKRLRRMPGSKIILPSSDAEDYYCRAILCSTISRIVNPEGKSARNFYTSDNCPSWWPKDVAFTPVSDGITALNLRKILAVFLEKCPEQYTISPPVETDQPEDPAVGTKRARMMSGSKIVLPSSDAEDYFGITLRRTIGCIANPKGRRSRNIYRSDNRPSWWPKDVAFSTVTGPKASISAVHQRMIVAAFLEKCPEQYTISPPVDQQHSGEKIVLSSSDVNEYTGSILVRTISRIVNPTRMKGRSSSRKNFSRFNCPSWWPKDVAFSPVTGPKAVANGITTVQRRKILAAFLEKCPEQYTISPAVDQQNSASTGETDQPEDTTIVDVETYYEESLNEDIEENVSIPSDPEDLLNSLEQHFLDSRKRMLEAERKVEELTKENERLRKEMKGNNE